MQICPRCGQMKSDESHQCAPAAIAPDQITGVRGAIVALVILLLSLGLFAVTLAFTVLHPSSSDAPVVIQTTLPTNTATAATGQDITTPQATITPTSTPAKHGASGGGSGAAQPTPTPKAPTPTTPPLPTAVPPTPTDTPQPTPTRLPQ